MSIGGNVKTKKAQGTGEMQVGLAVVKPLLFNPTKEELSEFLGRNVQKDIVYAASDNGVKRLQLDVWVEAVLTGFKYRIPIFLKNEQLINTNKQVRFVDKVGNTTYWISGKEKLPSFMVNNEAWQARKGEVELYKFLKAFTDEMERDDAEDRKLDWDVLLSGDVSELKELVGGPYASDVLALLTIRWGKTADGFKPFQSVYNKEFIPGDFIKYIKNPSLNKPFKYTEFINQIVNPTHGCKEFFGDNRELQLAHNYDPSKLEMATDAPLIETREASAATQAAGSTMSAGQMMEEDFDPDEFNDDDGELNTDY